MIKAMEFSWQLRHSDKWK